MISTFFCSDLLFSLNKYLNRQEVKTRHSITDLFLARFTLSDEVAKALSPSNVPFGPTLFVATD